MNEYKLKAKNKLFSDYLDKHGRVQESYKFLTGNPHLHTGQAAILLELNGLLNEDAIDKFYKGYKVCEVQDGLYSRHPDPYRNTEHYDVISHDEYNGLIFSSAAAIGINKPQYEVASKIVDYGEKNNYQYIDRFPNANFFNKFFKSPIKSYKEVRELSKVDDKARLKFDPDYQALLYMRQPRDVAFYKMVSPKHKASIFSILYFCLANIISVFKKEEYARGTSKILAIFRHEALRISNNDNFLTKLTRRIIYRKLKDLYGDEFLHVLMKTFFNQEDNHPFHSLSKGMKLK